MKKTPTRIDKPNNKEYVCHAAWKSLPPVTHALKARTFPVHGIAAVFESDFKNGVAKSNLHLSKRMPSILTMCQNVISSIFVKDHISYRRMANFVMFYHSHSYKFEQTIEYGNFSASNETTCSDPLFERWKGNEANRDGYNASQDAYLSKIWEEIRFFFDSVPAIHWSGNWGRERKWVSFLCK